MIVYIGCGGNAKDALSFFNCRNVWMVDDYKTGEFEHCSIIGTVDEFIRRYQLMLAKPKTYITVGSIGDNLERNRIYEKLAVAGVKTLPLVFTDKISRNVHIGDNCLINLGVQIHHDAYVGDGTVISPAATICGNVFLEGNNFIGAGAIVIQGITIGRNSVIGAGSVVVCNVPPDSIYAGNPAKLLKRMM